MHNLNGGRKGPFPLKEAPAGPPPEALSRMRSLDPEVETSRSGPAEPNRRLQDPAGGRERLARMLDQDLRGTVTGMAAHLEFLKMLMNRNADREKVALLIDHARESSRHLEALVADILDVLRLQESGMELNRSAVDLAALFRECCGDFQALAELEEKRIRIEVCRTVPEVPADPKVLRRMISNLLRHALMSSPFGGEVRLAAIRAGATVRIEVTDSGEGSPGSGRERIFERFADAPRPGDWPFPGLGPGLAFCRLAAEAHAGRIRVEPAENGGSRFVLALPLGAAPAAAGRPVAAAAGGPGRNG